MITETELLAFIERERQHAERQWLERRARLVWEQVEEGELITDLTLLEKEGQVLCLHAPVNESKFRRGDMLWLRDENDTVQVPVVFQEDSRLQQQIRVKQTEQGLPPTPWCLEGRMVDLSERLREAVMRIFALPESHEARRILQGNAVPGHDDFELRHYRQVGERQTLNEAQVEAFARALSCKNFTTIQGPPGTGKTAVIAAIVEQAVSEGKRVLITAQTHKAVNNALSAIEARRVNFPMVKYGNPDMALELSPDIERATRALPQGPGVVGAVLVAAAVLSGRTGPFDLVLFDEASQVTLPLAACGLMLGNRWVFVGDEKQLPPVVPSVSGDDPCARSIFAQLHGRGGTMLTETFRLNQGLTRWVSKEFYEGLLVPTLQGGMRTLRLKPGAPVHPLLDPRMPLVVGLMNHQGHHSESEEEALVAAELIRVLHHEHGFALRDLGVIAPFRAQNRLIRARTEALLHSPLEQGEEDLLIDTVDRAQGQQREVIVVSLASSDLDHVASLAGFLFSAERLNVAITRARTKCVVLFSEQVLKVRSNKVSDLPLLNRMHRMVAELPVVSLFEPAFAAEPSRSHFSSGDAP